MTISHLTINKLHSYADYLKWQLEERIELIKGKIYEMSGPSRVHQKLSGRIFLEVGTFLKDKTCEVYSAPFDVRLPKKSNNDRDIYTVVQPDICVVCDHSKLDDKGCLGAPDIVVEILSPGNNVKELKYKYEVYEEAGIKEYWIVSPQDRTFSVYTLKDGKYHPSRIMVEGDIVKSKVLPGFKLDLKALFDKID